MEEFEKLVAESFQNELLPVSDNGAEAAAVSASDPQAEPELPASDGETVPAGPHAGENDPAA